VVDITIIAFWLGHERRIETTHRCGEVDRASKQKGFEELLPAQGQMHQCAPEDELLGFLAALLLFRLSLA
jgi:hypothetical protein